MAQVFDRNGIYYARFMHNGKDYFRSTKIPVATGSKKAVREAKAQAEAELARMLAEIRGRESVDALFTRLVEGLGRLPKHEREPKRIVLADRLRQGVTARLAIADAWQAWLDNPKKRNPSPATIEMYLAYWGRDRAKKHGRRKVKNGFKNWLAANHEEVTYLHEVTPAIAEAYATHLWGSGVTPRTYNGAIKFLRAMFRVLKTQAGLASNPWDEIPAQDKDTEGRRNLTTEELEKVFAEAEGNLRYWIAIGLYTGLRLGDVVTLKWDGGSTVVNGKQVKLGVLLDERCIRIAPRKTRRKKKVLTYPLHPVLEVMLRELHDGAEDKKGFLFPADAKTHTKSTSAITRRIQKHFEDCGIQTTEEATGHRKRAVVRVGFHSLRHSFVSICADNKVPQHVIQALVGHGSPAMTRLYAHAGDEQMVKAIAALPAMTIDAAENGE